MADPVSIKYVVTIRQGAMSITEIGKEAARASTSDDGSQVDDDEHERIDVSGLDFIKLHPGPTAITGTARALRYLPPAPEDSEYDDNDRGSAGLILDDPSIPEDDGLEVVSIWQASASQGGDDFKVVNTDDPSVDVYDAGVSVGQMFESSEVDDFGVDDGIVSLSTSAGRSVARTLDVSGLANADVVRTDDGSPEIQENGYPATNDALIEKFPGNDGDTYEPPRYARDPQLRPDVEGEDVVIIIQHMSNVVEDYDGNSHWATVLADLDDGRQTELAETYAEDSFYDGDDPEDFIDDVNGTEMIRLAPTMEFEPDPALLRATQWHEWTYPSQERIEELRDEQGWTPSE